MTGHCQSPGGGGEGRRMSLIPDPPYGFVVF